MVVTSTHGNKIIDKVFVRQSDVYNCMVVKSLLKTKHMAVILSPAIETERCMELGPRQKVPVFDLREPFVNKLRYYIGMYDWDSLLNDCTDIDLCYTRFFKNTSLVNRYVPCKLVTVGPLDPDFITPRLKLLLRQRYRLRKQGRIKAAVAVASKINEIITAHRSARLSNLANATARELWTKYYYINYLPLTCEIIYI